MREADPPVDFEDCRLVRALARGIYVQPPLSGSARPTQDWREKPWFRLANSHPGKQTTGRPDAVRGRRLTQPNRTSVIWMPPNRAVRLAQRAALLLKTPTWRPDTGARETSKTKARNVYRWATAKTKVLNQQHRRALAVVTQSYAIIRCAEARRDSRVDHAA